MRSIIRNALRRFAAEAKRKGHFINFYNYDEQEFQKYVDFIEKNSLYDTGCELSYGESFVMLSTCNGHATDNRLVIVGVEK